jgi:radical SAM enzyme (TIGR01210 family)
MRSAASGTEPPAGDRLVGAREILSSKIPFEVTRAEIIAARGPKAVVDLTRPIAVFEEVEAVGPWQDGMGEGPGGADVVSLILAGAECALRCTMCDLWRQTLDHSTPRGALPRQIAVGLGQVASGLGQVGEGVGSGGSGRVNERWVKLYNASNFFDRRSVPREDWDAIAGLVGRFDRVIVENHPRFVGDEVFEFARRLEGRLEVAIGLEAADDAILRMLNKKMTCRGFESAASKLRRGGVDVRAFVMLGPPGCGAEQRIGLLLKTLRFAAQCGVRHVSVIPTRGGNGMMERLRDAGWFVPPGAGDLEAAMRESFGLGLPMVITADLWDWGNLQGHCEACRETRLGRMRRVNLGQRWFESADAEYRRGVGSGREGCECHRG